MSKATLAKLFVDKLPTMAVEVQNFRENAEKFETSEYSEEGLLMILLSILMEEG